MGNFLRASHDADLVEGSDFGGQPAVHAQDSAVDDGGEGQEVEDLAARFPDAGITIFLLAFFVKAVDLGDLTGFVVAADKSYSVGKSRKGVLAPLEWQENRATQTWPSSTSAG